MRLQRWRVSSDEEDRLVWAREKCGKFYVKAMYKVLELGGPSNFPVVVIWNSWVPPKVNFFAWEATWSKVLTLDLLMRRGWSMENKCFLCHKQKELIDHMLIHYIKTQVLWHLLFSLFGVSWVLPSSIRELLLSWHKSFVGRKRKKVW